MERQDIRNPGPRTLGDFLGRWRLSREIAGAPGPARFEGSAEIRAEIGAAAEGAVYDEDGWLTLADGSTFRATRRYLWRAAPEGIAVLFEDGRPFHTVRLADPRPEAEHLCVADLYRVVYDFRRWPDWECRWQVAGPGKDYVMLSRYWRG